MVVPGRLGSVDLAPRRAQQAADEDGRFDWAEPDEEVHRFVNDLEWPIGTYLYGRRMYEVTAYWETMPRLSDLTCGIRFPLRLGPNCGRTAGAP